MNSEHPMERITAPANDKIKYAVRLAAQPAFRRAERAFFLEGARLCADAAASGLPLLQVFLTADAAEKYAAYLAPVLARAAQTYEIGEAAARRLSDTEHPQGVFCICGFPDGAEETPAPQGRYLALEQVQDPANLGAISRSAEALGLDGLIVSGGCDRWNPKALRASMGALLRLPILETDDLPALLRAAAAAGMQTLAAVPDGTAADIRTVSHPGGVICCIGNEGAGLTQAAQAACAVRTVIPMRGRAESLNAAAAAAILAWELQR